MKTTRTTTRRSFFLLALMLMQLTTIVPTAYAGFDFAPIIANLAPSGERASTSFTVTNQDPTKLAVQVSIVPREPDLDGKEVYKESDAIDEMFRIFPAHLIVDSKGNRAVRVTYIGSPQLKSELAFRIIAEELPVDLDDPKRVYTKAVAKITLSTRYIGSLYVTPSGSKPAIVIDAKKSESAANHLVLNITNNGTAHQIYRKPIVKVKALASGKEIQLDEADTRPLMSQNILAGRSRRYNLPWPKGLEAGLLKVTLDTGKE